MRLSDLVDECVMDVDGCCRACVERKKSETSPKWEVQGLLKRGRHAASCHIKLAARAAVVVTLGPLRTRKSLSFALCVIREARGARLRINTAAAHLSSQQLFPSSTTHSIDNSLQQLAPSPTGPFTPPKSPKPLTSIKMTGGKSGGKASGAKSSAQS